MGKLEDALKSIATNDDFDLETETPLDKLVQWWQDIVTDLQGVQKSLTVLSLGTELRLKAMEAKWKTLLTRYQTYQQRVCTTYQERPAASDFPLSTGKQGSRQ